MEKLVNTLEDWKTVLYSIDPARLDDEEWYKIQAAWNEEDLPFQIIDEWNRQDADRYDQRMNERRFESFNRASGKKVSGGTLIEIAKEHGFRFSDLPSGPGRSVHRAPQKRPRRQVLEPMPLSPVDQLRLYMETLFEPGELVNIVTEWTPKAKDPGKANPKGNGTDKPVEEWLALLAEHPDRITDTIGNYTKDYGAWIRVNPLNGVPTPNGKRKDGSIKYSRTADVNVTAFRNAVVETDHIGDLQEQLDKITDLEIPAAAIIYSGGKSVHAICRIDAPDRETYSERVSALFDYMEKNGFPIDKENRNPSRLSRLPGVERGDKMQYLVSVAPSASWAAFEGILKRQEEPADREIKKQYDFKLIPFSEVEPEESEWIIENYLLCGGINFLVGAGGSAKTFLECHILACISAGKPTIFDEDLLHPPDRPPRNVIILNSEDPANSILHPRLKAAGADMSRVLTIPMEHESFSALDFEVLPWEEWCEQYHPAVIAFDPLQYFLPQHTDLNDRVAVRQIMHDVASAAQRFHFAPLLVGHTNKRSAGSIRELFGGTADLTDIGRVVLGAGKLRNGQFFAAVGKQNYTEHPPSIIYHIDKDAGAIRYDYRSDETFEALMSGVSGSSFGNGKDKQKRVAAAEELIVDLLRNGPMSGSELQEATRAEVSDHDRRDALKALRDLKIIELYHPKNTSGKPGRNTAYRMIHDAKIPWERTAPQRRHPRPGE